MELDPKKNLKQSDRPWLWSIALPLFVPFAIDQITKYFGARRIEGIWFTEHILIKFQPNYGMFMGSMADSSELLRTVMLSTAGVFILFVFTIIQTLVPLRSLMFRAGLSIFVGSVMGNIVDRIAHGYVIDFLMFKTPTFSTGVFNSADATQWIGALMTFAALVKYGELLWPMDERRGRKWIKPDFQWRYCLTYAGSVALICSVLGTLSFTFLRMATKPAPGFPTREAEANLLTFSITFALVSGVCIIAAALFARSFSHRIAGPILAFENFLENLLQGKSRQLRLRSQDEFTGFEQIADRFQTYFQGKLGVDPEPLRAGQQAPALSAKDRTDELINLEQYKGQKVWLSLYRYATCPMCVEHIAEVLTRYNEIEKAGIQFIAVFESRKDQFVKPNTGATQKLMENIPFPMIADPEKKIYRAYRAKVSLWAVFRPKVLWVGLRATLKGYRQKELDGALGQIPAHFLIAPNGKIHTAYYGSTVADNIPWSTVEKFASEKIDQSENGHLAV